MIRLLGVELRRFVWRRSFRFFGLVVLGFVALAATITFFNTRDGSFPVTALTDIFGGTSIPLIILGLAFGASFIGAEWHAHTITPLLTWQPRRALVLAGKAAAVAIAVISAALAIQAILGLALWFVAAVRGTTEGADIGWFIETVAIAGRGAIIAGLAAILGFGLAAIVRNTAAVLIVGFVYFAVGEAILRVLRPHWQPWLIGDNAAAFVIGRPDDVFGPAAAHPLLGSLLVVAAYAAAMLGLAIASFETRDVN